MMKIQHAAVARFYLYERVRDTTGKPTDEYLIAMEFVDGNDLARMIHVLGPIPWAFVVRWGLSLLEGLAVIHQNGFIHRDVKPANVMILGPLPESDVSPSQTKAKLLDLGAVKQADDEETGPVGRKRIFVGTREYAAPEQWDERPVPESDIYALGATLFHVLTGRVPYEVEGRDALAFMKAHRRAPVPRVSDFIANVPEDLDTLIYRMLAKDPYTRGTATELVQEFRELLPASEPTTPTRQAKANASKPPAPRPLVQQAEPQPMSKPEPKSQVHALVHPIISVLERIFLPQRLRPPVGHEPPLPERLAALFRRPLLLFALVTLIALLVWLLL
jgi:serine/threonine protein kinase